MIALAWLSLSPPLAVAPTRAGTFAGQSAGPFGVLWQLKRTRASIMTPIVMNQTEGGGSSSNDNNSYYNYKK